MAAFAIRLASSRLTTEVIMVLNMALPRDPPALRNEPIKPAETPSSSCGTRSPDARYESTVTQVKQDCPNIGRIIQPVLL